ncbi:unnamed protein product [Effrenium voratum]|nr:unnamed protein product [Effrenium voratum]
MADSGLLVGIFMTGGMVGNALMTAALHLWPDTWQKLRSWLRWCLFCDVCSAVCYVLVLQHVAFLGSWALFCLLLCRFCGGLGMGSTGQLAAVVIAQVTKAEELPNQMQRLQFWQSLGLGMGPPVAACALWAYDALPWQLGTRRAAACGVLVLLQALTALAVARCPAHLAPVGSPPPQSGSKISSGGRSHLIGACWLLCALRGYAVAGAEVGTAVLLETGYGWTSRSIGLMIGWAFIASVPLRFAYTRLKDRLSTGLWIRVMSLCAIAGTCFLFSSASAVGLNLVLADLIIFPALYLGEGLTRGLMMQMVQDQAAVSVNTASFVAIAINNLARTLAPWLARFSISAGQPEEGQNLFAWGQLLCCVLFLIVFEVGIQRAS